MSLRMVLDEGERDGIVMLSTSPCGARGTPCAVVTSLKTQTFHPEFEVFVWRGSLQNSKKLIVPYGTITFCSLKVNEIGRVFRI